MSYSNYSKSAVGPSHQLAPLFFATTAEAKKAAKKKAKKAEKKAEKKAAKEKERKAIKKDIQLLIKQFETTELKEIIIILTEYKKAKEDEKQREEDFLERERRAGDSIIRGRRGAK